MAIIDRKDLNLRPILIGNFWRFVYRLYNIQNNCNSVFISFSDKTNMGICSKWPYNAKSFFWYFWTLKINKLWPFFDLDLIVLWDIKMDSFCFLWILDRKFISCFLVGKFAILANRILIFLVFWGPRINYLKWQRARYISSWVIFIGAMMINIATRKFIGSNFLQLIKFIFIFIQNSRWINKRIRIHADWLTYIRRAHAIFLKRMFNRRFNRLRNVQALICPSRRKIDLTLANK